MKINPAQARANITIKLVEKNFSKFAIYPVVASYLLNHLHLDLLFKDILKTKNSNFSFSGTEYLLTFFTIIFLGIKRIYKIDDVLFEEKVLAEILGFKKKQFPSGRQIYRLLESTDHWSVKKLDKVNFKLLLKHKKLIDKTRWLNIDIDQTKKITESKTIQKSKPCFNSTKKGRMGLRISASTVNNLVFSQKLEPGNTNDRDSFKELFIDTLSKVDKIYDFAEPDQEKIISVTTKKVGKNKKATRPCSKRIIFRVDGGYFSKSFLEIMEKTRSERKLDFIVRAPKNLKLAREAREKAQKEGNDFVKIFESRNMEVLTLKNQQVLEGLDHKYKVLIIKDKQKQIKSRKKKIYHATRSYEYILITTLGKWSVKRIIKHYKKRQGIENVFKEQNQSFKADKLPTHKFWGNAFYFQMVSLVFNISFFFKAGSAYKKT